MFVDRCFDFKMIVGILTVGTFLVGCGNQVSKSVQQAVIDNQEAKSLDEWEQSSANPEALFDNWRTEVASDPTQLENVQKEICKEFLNLDGQPLSIFENEIRSNKNESLVKPCLKELHKKLETYHAFERSRMAVSVNALQSKQSRNNFQFPANTQFRDISKGYYAVSGDIAKKEVILTFDDGPNAIYTTSILQSLKEVNAKAIFFHLGKNVLQNPSVVKKVAEGGHAIGSHTSGHFCLGSSDSCLKHNGRVFSPAEAISEIKSGHQALYDVLGWADPFFRFPYGETSRELKNFLNENATAEFAWNIESEDWRAQPTESYLSNILGQLAVKGRGILLMHDIQRRTAEALPLLLRELYSQGYNVVLLQAADPTAKHSSKLVKKRLP